ncbi:hypothetical protein [Halorubrum trapanicum]|uniref:hypothetical protein n=1 Tax=Halorubrum trapanicum TaxID=29284 RepID=UPI0037445180
MFDDAVHLQFGVGSLGDALMGELQALDFGDREGVYFGGLIQDGLFDMLDAGGPEAASESERIEWRGGNYRLTPPPKK